MAQRFAPAETTQAYMQTLDTYLTEHGRPVVLYSDKHSICRVNRPNNEGEITQFTRALKTLDINPIHAHTPPAKGRVERANKTLQDRLVKELRLRGIDPIDTANAFLPAFISDYNSRFAIPPQQPMDAHRKVLHSTEERALSLSLHRTRKLTRQLTVQFHNQEYQIQGQAQGYRLRGTTITVCEAFDGEVTLLHKGHTMPYRILAQGEPPVPIEDQKTVRQAVEQANTRQAGPRAPLETRRGSSLATFSYWFCCHSITRQKGTF